MEGRNRNSRKMESRIRISGKWKTEISDMEEALKKDIDSSLNDISTWNKANKVYLHVNVEVAETFTNINSPK